MKKKTLLILFVAVACSIVISSYKEGPCLYSGWECTGAETDNSNPNGCSTGKGCHATSATPGIAVTIELDSAGIPTTRYIGGMTYTIKITGVNNTSNSLPAFGFQIGSITDTVPSATPTNAGIWTSPYPTNTHYSAPATYYLVGVVENSRQIAPTSGSGGSGTVYGETLNWTAPVKGTGTISVWGALNAVDNNGTNDAGDLWNTTHIVIHEEVVSGIASIDKTVLNMSVFPNPATDNTVLDYTLTENSTVQVNIYDISGQKICNLNYGEQSTGEHHQRLNISELNLKSGIYIIAINTGNTFSTRKLIVQ